ncbi:MAG: ABC transporter transmembrane domain-containing protein [Alphaproteobacteria bacterium]|nr:ABC transporter transmembrane domain-containing protein [Alphaproteobacteria bacterium]
MTTPKQPQSAGPEFAALGLLWPFLRPYRMQAAGAAVALLAAAGLSLGIGQGLRLLIDTGFTSGSAAGLDAAAIVMFAIVAGLACATTARYYLVSWLGERVSADLRRAAFDHVLTLSPDFFETARTGDLLSRLTADIALLQTLVGSAVSQGLRTFLLLIGAFAMLFTTSPKLALIVLLVVPFVVAPLILFGRREKRLSRRAQDRVADLNAAAEETISSIRTVQAFTREALERTRYADGNERAVSAALRRVATRAVLILGVILLGFGAITLSLWVGGRDVVAGRMSGGDLSAFVFYAVLLATSGASLSELWGDLKRAVGAAERLLELLAVRPTIARPALPAHLPAPSAGRIEFCAVTFIYPGRPDRAALEDFSLTIAPGESVALVGPSGAGKSTVLDLLLRFRDPQQGRILVDGVDIATVDPAELRARIGIVPQDPVMFSADAAANIGFGRDGATEDEIRAAADAAAASGFIDALPQGFATHLGAKGVTLSGGQRQRIAIARALVRNPAILLLDEATSALDALSEQDVQRALDVLTRGRTTLVVAHRLATIRRADRIVVMQAGRIVASGRHDELVREGGLYARLAALQFTDGRDQPLPQTDSDAVA